MTTDMGAAPKLHPRESREQALMLAATGGDPQRESVRSLMSGPIDWAALTRLAVNAHATPGIWAVVSAYPGLPREAQALQSLAVVNDFRRYHIRSLVGRVVGELREAGIEVLALKGAALLVGGVNRDLSRTMSDIDILVTKGSPEKAWRVCVENGWTMVDPTWTEDVYATHHHLPPLLDPDGIQVGLEVHRALLLGIEHLGIDVAAIRDRSRQVDVGGVPVRVPSAEDLLLHDCLHFAWSNKLQHGSWRAFADAHLIVSDARFDWDRFLSVALATRARQCCYWTLRLAHVLADLPVPDHVLATLDPRLGGSWAGLLERHFVRQILDPEAEVQISERVRRWLWYAALHERGTSDRGTNPWNVGAVEVPGEGPSKTAPRGALKAALSTVGYLTGLVTSR